MQLADLLSENLKFIQELNKEKSFLIEIDSKIITYVKGK